MKIINYKPQKNDNDKALARKRAKDAINKQKIKLRAITEKGANSLEGSREREESKKAKETLEALENAKTIEEEMKIINYKPWENDNDKALSRKRAKDAINKQKIKLRAITEKGANSLEGSREREKSKKAKETLEALENAENTEEEMKIINYKPQKNDDKMLQRKKSDNDVKSGKKSIS